MKTDDGNRTFETEKTKKPYENAEIQEHEPLEEAVATVYYYYTYG